MDAAELRTQLARRGVGLFECADGPEPPNAEELAGLIAALVASGDERLVAAVPCALVRWSEVASDATGLARERLDERLDERGRTRLALLYRLARALAISREPDLSFLLGPRTGLVPRPEEPSDLPDPGESFGERCLDVALELDEESIDASVVGDVVDLFDNWLVLLADELALTARA